MIEIMIAAVIMMGAIVIASRLLIEGARMTRNGEDSVKENDAARTAGEAIASSIQLAGMGASGGINLVQSGTVKRVSAIIGVDSTDGGSDELWVVLPNPRALRQTCIDFGAAARVETDYTGVGVLNVNCIESINDAGVSGILLVTGAKASAVLTAPTFNAGSGDGGFVDSPDLAVAGLRSMTEDEIIGQAKFRSGDMIFPATIVHYYQGNDAAGLPSLFRSFGTMSAVATGLPFVDVAGTQTVITHGIEDVQLAFGVTTVGGVTQTYQNSFGPTWTGVPLLVRSVRVGVVAVSERIFYDSNGQKRLDTGFTRMANENNPAGTGGTADGLKRTLYRRRVELPNLAPNNL